MNYLVTYTRDHSYSEEYAMIYTKPNATWRELQEIFDPKYFYSNLRFFPLGDEIVYKEVDLSQITPADFWLGK